MKVVEIYKLFKSPIHYRMAKVYDYYELICRHYGANLSKVDKKSGVRKYPKIEEIKEWINANTDLQFYYDELQIDKIDSQIIVNLHVYDIRAEDNEIIMMVGFEKYIDYPYIFYKQGD